MSRHRNTVFTLLLLNVLIGLASLLFLSEKLSVHADKILPWYGFVFYLFLFTLIQVVAGLIWLTGIQREILKKAWLSSCTIFFVLFFFEIALRITGLCATRTEKFQHFFVSRYHQREQTWYHTAVPGSLYTMHGPEFKFEDVVNNMGYAGKLPDPSDTADLLVTLGDSFTQGVGVPVDSAYPCLLLHQLNYSCGTHFKLLNAGMAGADPFFAYMNLRDKALPLKPSLVLVTYTRNDVQEDYRVFGGFERFQSDSTTLTRSGPAYGSLYALSHVARLVLKKVWGINEMLISNSAETRQSEEVDAAYIDLVRKFDQLAVQHDFKVLWVKRPDQFELEQGKYNYEFSKIDSAIDQTMNGKRVDLMPHYLRYVAEDPDMKKYYWPIDQHHNLNGYRMMATGIYKAVRKEFPELACHE